MMGGNDQKGGRILAIDALRCLAALAVLLLHVPHGTEGGRVNAWLLVAIPIDFGYLGVMLFLVISGFCIHLAVARTMDHPGAVRLSWVAFWKRRFFRLYPPYLAAIAFSLVLYYYWTNPQILDPNHRITEPFWDLATHLLLVHNFFYWYGTALGNSPFWTLGMEEQLYALYPIYLALRTRVRVMRALGYTLCLTLAWRMWTAYSDANHLSFGAPPLELSNMGIWPFGYWAFWVSGAVAAEAYSGAIRLPAWCYRTKLGLLCFFIGASTNSRTLGRLAGSNWLASHTGMGTWLQIVWPLTELSDVFFATSFFIWVNRLIVWERQGFRGIQKTLIRAAAPLGAMSYSLYLVHVPVLQVLETAFERVGLGYEPWEHGLRYVVMVPTALAVAWVFYVTVERWFIRNPKRSDKLTDERGRTRTLGEKPAEPISAPSYGMKVER